MLNWKRTRSVLLMLALVLSAAVAAEENNPCIDHDMEESISGGPTITNWSGLDYSGNCTSTESQISSWFGSRVALGSTGKHTFSCRKCSYSTSNSHSSYLKSVTCSMNPTTRAYSVTAVAGCHDCDRTNRYNKSGSVTHDWSSDRVVECDTAVSWQISSASLSVACNETGAAAALSKLKSQLAANNSYSLTGSCRGITFCSICGEEKDGSVTTRPFSLEAQYVSSPGSSLTVGGNYSVRLFGKCHEEKNWISGSISVLPHDYSSPGILGSSTKSSCNRQGRPRPNTSEASYEQEKTIYVPVGYSGRFNVEFTGTLGITSYEAQKCKVCNGALKKFQQLQNGVWVDAPLLVTHAPVTGEPELSGCELALPVWDKPYGVTFPSVGDATVSFKEHCENRNYSTLFHPVLADVFFHNVDVPGCANSNPPSYKFTVKATAAAALTVTNSAKRPLPSGLELPSLSAGYPVPTELEYLQLKTDTTEGFELVASSNYGDSWPNQAASNYYFNPEQEAPKLQPWPVWSIAEPKQLGLVLDPADGNRKVVDPCRRTIPNAAGLYVVGARCGIGSDPTHGRSVAVSVVAPSTSVEMYVLDQEEKRIHELTLTPCGASPLIPLEFSASAGGLPDGCEVKVTIAGVKRSNYELYRKLGENNYEKVGHEVLTRTVNGTFSDTIYVKPLAPEEDNPNLSNYRLQAEYSLSGSSIRVEAKNTFSIEWLRCSTGFCSAGDLSVRQGSIHFSMPFGGGEWESGGGVWSTDMETLDQRVFSIVPLDDQTAAPTQFFFPAGVSVLRIAAADSLENADRLAGYPLRVKNGRWATEFSYSFYNDSGDIFLSGITAKTWYCTDSDVTVAVPPGSTPIAETSVNLIYHVPPSYGGSSNLQINQTKWALNGNSKTKTWYYTSDTGSSATEVGTRNSSLRDPDGTAEYFGKETSIVNGVKQTRIGRWRTGGRHELTVKREFPWGEEVVSETRNHDETTTYEYVTSGDGYGLLHKVVYPQGDSVEYTYNANAEVIRVESQRGGRTTVTLNSYSTDDQGRRVTTSVTTQGTVELSRRVSRVPVIPTVAPSVIERYGENGVVLTTTTYYTVGPKGAQDYRPSRRINPDGTESRYSYVRSGGTETVTVENGVFLGDQLQQGSRSITVTDSIGVTHSTAVWTIDTAKNLELQTGGSTSTEFDTLGRATKTVYFDNSVEQRTYNCCGIKTSIDRDGILTTYNYSTNDVLFSTECDGIKNVPMHFSMDGFEFATITGREGIPLESKRYYANGYATEEMDFAGRSTYFSHSYSSSNGMRVYTETTTNPNQSTVTNTYRNGELVSVTGTGVHPRSYEYGANWSKVLPQNVTTYTDRLGNTVRTVYADNSEETRHYNAKNQLVKAVSPAGRVTLYGYDALGRQNRTAIDLDGDGEISAADFVTTVTMDYETCDGKTVAVTRRKQRNGSSAETLLSVTRQTLDGQERWETDLAGLTTHFQRERLGSGSVRQTTTAPDGSKSVTMSLNGRVLTQSLYDAAGVLGNVTTYGYDRFNRVSQTVTKRGDTVLRTQGVTYDGIDRTLTQTLDGQTTTIAYSDQANSVTRTLPGARVIVESYHPTGELKRLSGADNYTREWTYDAVWGSPQTLTTWRDADTPQVTTWVYDNRGRLSQKRYPDNLGPVYTYDADGLLLTRTWARGVTTTYSYDTLGRLTGQSYSDGTASVSMTYDAWNRPLTVTDAAGTRNFVYNSSNQLESETNPVIVNQGLHYTYDNYGRMTGMALRIGENAAMVTAGYGYDAEGRLSTLGNGAETLHYAYRPGQGQLAGAVWKSSAGVELSTREYQYDAQHRLTGIYWNNEAEINYTLDAANRRTAAQLGDGTSWNYTYDLLSQLTSAERRDSAGSAQPGGLFQYSYDGIGNRLTSNESNALTSYESNQLNQYTLINTVIPTYDADGNMLTHGDWTYTWNGENRLIQASAGTRRITFDYDYMGRRFEKKVYDAELLTKHEKYAYSGYKLIEIRDGLNGDAVTHTFTWQPDGVDGYDIPLSLTYGGETFYYVLDGNKNVLGLLDSSNARVASYTYGPFGQLLTSEGVLAQANPFRFSSEFHDDETGLVYYNYRYYNPALGRWTKRDPIEEKGGINLYGMCGNNLIDNDDINGFIISVTASRIRVNKQNPDYNPSGFIVKIAASKTAECCIPKLNRKGHFVLVQYIWKQGEWKIDRDFEVKDMREGEIGDTFFVYAHSDIGPNKEATGRLLDPEKTYGGYVDTPGIYGVGKAQSPYSAEFRIEAFCRCAEGDFFDKDATVEFIYSRSGDEYNALYNGVLGPIISRKGSNTLYPGYSLGIYKIVSL